MSDMTQLAHLLVASFCYEIVSSVMRWLSIQVSNEGPGVWSMLSKHLLNNYRVNPKRGACCCHPSWRDGEMEGGVTELLRVTLVLS